MSLFYFRIVSISVCAIRLTSCFVYRLTETYWSNLQKSQSDRPIARLKLAACADAALVWDGTRGFELTDEERDVVSTVVSPEKALTYSRDAPVEGAVVGVWRRGGRGVGRWPNADPVIPRR